MTTTKYEIKIVYADMQYPTSASDTASVEDVELLLAIRLLDRNHVSMFRSKPKKTGKKN